MRINCSIEDMNIIFYTLTNCKVRNPEMSPFIRLSDKVNFDKVLLGERMYPGIIELSESEHALLKTKLDEVGRDPGWVGPFVRKADSFKTKLNLPPETQPKEEEKEVKENEPKT